MCRASVSGLAHLTGEPQLSHHGPSLLATADVDDEAAEDVLAAERVSDFGVELDAVDGLLVVGNGGERGGFRRRDGGKVFRKRVQSVRVRHPDRRLVRDAFEKLVEVSRSVGRLAEDFDDRLAVFPVVRSLDARAKVVGGFLRTLPGSALSLSLHSRSAGCTHLETVADSEDGDAGVVNGRVNPRRILLVNRERRARQNDACASRGISACCKGTSCRRVSPLGFHLRSASFWVHGSISQ